MEDDFKCNINVRPISEWVKDNNSPGCPSCLIAPLSSFYLGVLEEEGENNLANELKETFEKGDILTICEKLDSIKLDVGEVLSNKLRNLDCFAQTFKQDEASK
jgi:hypothetical protein